MALPPFNIISLCSGNGTGDLALRLAVRTAVTRVYVEREAHACEALVRAMEAGVLAEAAVWSDVKSFDGRPYLGSVDCIVATYPCQPFSCAGKRLGDKDPRHLWPDIARIISEARPPLVYLENVRGHLRLGFERVCEDLQSMGYETRAGLFSAEEVGAPHGRIRLFAMAYRKTDNRWGELKANRTQGRGTGSTGGSGELAILARPRLPGRDHHTGDGGKAPGQQAVERRGAELADPDSHGFGGCGISEPFGQHETGSPELDHATRRLRTGQDGKAGSGRGTCRTMHDLDRSFPFPPYRTGDWDRWAEVLVSHPWLRPSLSQAETEHLLRRVADGIARQLEFSRERIDRIRAVGLGVSPVSMAFAFRVLAQEHGIDFDTEEPV